MQTQNQYVPGVCNIGKNEIAKRQTSGWIGLIFTVGFFGLFAYLEVPHFWRLFIFIPTTASAAVFLQAGMHFCAYFGLQGAYNFSPEIGKTDFVDYAEYRAKDRKKAWQIILYSAAIGIIAALIAYYLPV